MLLSKDKRRSLMLFLTGVTIMLLLKECASYQDLTLLTIAEGNKDFSKTKIIFAFPDNPAIIWDQHNKLYRIYSGHPDSITVANNTRVVVFTEPVILKSNADSIEIGPDYAKLYGYLGDMTDERKFSIDAQGKVQFGYRGLEF